MPIDLRIVLPRIMWEDTLAASLSSGGLRLSGLPEPASDPDDSPRITFDWRAVRFFDDIALLKLLMIEYALRHAEMHVHHTGLVRGGRKSAAVAQQLWTCGYIELLTSCQLWGPDLARRGNVSDLLGFDPSSGLQGNKAPVSVMRIIGCHTDRHFERSSRAAKRIAEFAGNERRSTFVRDAESQATSWELIESGAFRGLILDQARWNVKEHAYARDSRGLGLAIARIVDPAEFRNSWCGISSHEDPYDEIIASGHPFAKCLENAIDANSAFLYVNAIDDGRGISAKLARPLRKKLASSSNTNVSSTDCFAARFASTMFWPDEKAQRLAFATDPEGSSKPFRPPGHKGLTTITDRYTIGKQGHFRISSGGVALNIDDPSPTIAAKHLEDCSKNSLFRYYGVPSIDPLKWSPTRRPGTAISLLTPLGNRVDRTIPRTRVIAPSPILPHSDECMARSERVATIWGSRSLDDTTVTECSRHLVSLARRASRDCEPELVIFDWSELPRNKDTFRALVPSLAKELAREDVKDLAPFVFAQFPPDMLPMLSSELRRFSEFGGPPTLVFAAGIGTPHWLGLDLPNISSSIAQPIRRGLTGEAETSAQSYVRATFSSVLEYARPASMTTLLPDGKHAPLEWVTECTARMQVCPMFREETTARRDLGTHLTRRFAPLFSFKTIAGAVRGLFCEELNAIVSRPPVLFSKPNFIELRPGTCVSDYYRCDSLVDDSIADALADELTDIALGFAHAAPRGRIDYVVSCTSPTNWFVHKIVDGLRAHGIVAAHYVFTSLSDLSGEIADSSIGRGHNVLFFTDVISTGTLACKMAELVRDKQSHVVGLIALIDTRTPDEIGIANKLFASDFEGRAVALVPKPTIKHQRSDAEWRVNSETATPERNTLRSTSWSEIEEQHRYKDFEGTGSLASLHGLFSDPQALLRRLLDAKALRIGHFQHGAHHSPVFCDVRRAFAHPGIEDAICSSLFEYVLRHNIRLIICPNHSIAYVLRDAFALRFPNTRHPEHRGDHVTFATASRVRSSHGENNYNVTTLDANHGGEWPLSTPESVMILDDGICSGNTIRSLLSEVIRISHAADAGIPSNGVDATIEANKSTDIDATNGKKCNTEGKKEAEEKASIHIVVFVNRLSRNRTAFYEQLAIGTEDGVVFSSLLSLPLKAYGRAECPLCHRRQKLLQLAQAIGKRGHMKHFLSTWADSLNAVDPHEAPYGDTSAHNPLDGPQAHTIAVALRAIDDRYRPYIDRLLASLDTQARSVVVSALLERSHDFALKPEDKLSYLSELVLHATTSASTTDLVVMLRTILGSLIDDAGHLPVDTISTLGKIVLSRLAGHLAENDILGGLATFVALAQPILRGSGSRGTADEESWLTLLREELAKLPDGLCKDNTAFLIGCIMKPELSVGSIGEAVMVLYHYNASHRPDHISDKGILANVSEMLKKMAGETKPVELNSYRVSILQAVDLFDEMIQAAVLLSRACLSKSEQKVLQGYTGHLSALRQLCEPESLRQQETHSDQLVLAQRIAKTYAGLYDTFFAPDDPANRPLPRLIQHFTAPLGELVEAAVESFRPGRIPSESLSVQVTGVHEHRAQRVILQQDRLSQVLAQCLANIDKHWDGGSDVHVSVNIAPPEGRKITLTLKNTGFSDEHARLTGKGGLDVARRVVEEYNGQLDSGREDQHWVVKLTLIPWPRGRTIAL